MLKEFFQFKFLTLGTGTRKYIEKLKKKNRFGQVFGALTGNVVQSCIQNPAKKIGCFRKYLQKNFVLDI